VASVSGVVTAYLVALAVAMPASGWLGDRFGARRVMLGSIGLFTVASAFCGMATSLPELVALRAVQGIGGGILIPVGMAMMFRAFPPAERIREQLLIVRVDGARAVGQVGGLVDGLSGDGLYVNVPVGAAALPSARCSCRAVAASRLQFDLPGFLLAGSGFPLL
jgi:MFS family permease